MSGVQNRSRLLASAINLERELRAACASLRSGLGLLVVALVSGIRAGLVEVFEMDPPMVIFPTLADFVGDTFVHCP